MKALSIRQPWAFLIISGQKDIENRYWSTEYRGSLLIHASKTLDRAALERFPLPQQQFERGGIIGITELVDVVTESESTWFEGPYGFVLQHARPLAFIPYRGVQGLFECSIDEAHMKRLQRTVRT